MTKTDERPVRKEISTILNDTLDRIKKLFLEPDYTVWDAKDAPLHDPRPYKNLPGETKLRRLLMSHTLRIENLTTGKEESRVFYSPEKPKMTEEEIYRIEVICNNCGGVITNQDGTAGFVIPKGTAAGVFLRDKECKNCGLIGTIRRKFYPEPFLS